MRTEARLEKEAHLVAMKTVRAIQDTKFISGSITLECMDKLKTKGEIDRQPRSGKRSRVVAFFVGAGSKGRLTRRPLQYSSARNAADTTLRLVFRVARHRGVVMTLPL